MRSHLRRASPAIVYWHTSPVLSRLCACHIANMSDWSDSRALLNSPPAAPTHSPHPPKKRKTTEVEIHEKLKAIQRVKNGCPRYILSQELGVHLTTLDGWIKKEKSLQKWVTEHNDVTPKVKRLRKPIHETIDKAMWLWHRERKAVGCTFTGPGVTVQALHFRNELGESMAFTASQGWVTKWQKRYGVKFGAHSGKPESTEALNNGDVVKIRAKFASMIEEEGLMPDQVFFCDFIGLNYRQFPNLQLKGDNADAQVNKRQKQRVTVMTCSNAAGTMKLPLVLVGKFPKPRALKNLTQLPIYYKHQQSSYITGIIFMEWFHEEFFTAATEFLITRGLSPKAVLLMDNFLLLPKDISRESVRVQFLDSDTMEIIQPIEQNWCRNLKIAYRQQLIKFLVNNMRMGTSLDEAMKNLNIRDVIYWIANSWSTVTEDDIVKSWKQLWPQMPCLDSLPQVAIPANPLEIEMKTEDVEFEDNCLESVHQNEPGLLSEFCDVLNSTKVYHRIKPQDIAMWLHPASKVTEDECLEEAEIVQIIREEKEAGQIYVQPIVPERAKITLAMSQASLKTVIDYCSLSEHYSREQRLALIAIRETMKTDPSRATGTSTEQNVSTLPFDFVEMAESEENEYNIYEK